MAAGDLRPLWPTEIVDRAIATVRAHFRVHAEAATLGSLPLAVGAIVLQTIMEELGASTARVSARGVREGVVLREARRLAARADSRPGIAA